MEKLDLEILDFDKNPILKLRDRSIYPQSIDIASIEQTSTFQKVVGTGTRIFTGLEDVKRKITVPFFTYDRYEENFAMLRDELFDIFAKTGNKPFYIREIRDGYYSSGKQYQVFLSDVVELKKDYKFSTGTLVFETAEIPYAQSIKSTGSLAGLEGFESDDSWSFGMGLELKDEEDMPVYEGLMDDSNNHKFYIFNAGNVPINPFEHELLIKIQDIVYGPDMPIKNVELKNMTNDTKFKINLDETEYTTIVVDGVDVKGDGLNALSDTRLSFLELDVGWNRIALFGPRSVHVSFDFRFLYR